MEDEDFVVEEQDDQEPEVEEQTDEVQESEEVEEENEPSEPEADEEDDRIVVIGDETPDEKDEEAPGWVKKVRKVNRKLESENKRLKRELEMRSTQKQQEQAPPEVGEKPTLKSVGFSDKKYEAALAEYYERKRQAEEYQAKKSQELEKQKQEWQERQKRYVEQKQTHNFKDFEDAEEMVSNVFTNEQQGIIVHGADDSALVVYALGKNPKKLEELASEKDPVRFAWKVAKLEAQLKVKSKKTPNPEKKVKNIKSGGLVTT